MTDTCQWDQTSPYVMLTDCGQYMTREQAITYRGDTCPNCGRQYTVNVKYYPQKSREIKQL